MTNDTELVRKNRGSIATVANLIPHLGAFFGKLIRPLLSDLSSRSDSEYNTKVINRFLPRAMQPERFFMDTEKYSDMMAKSRQKNFEGIITQIHALQKPEARSMLCYHLPTIAKGIETA